MNECVFILQKQSHIFIVMVITQRLVTIQLSYTFNYLDAIKILYQSRNIHRTYNLIILFFEAIGPNCKLMNMLIRK